VVIVGGWAHRLLRYHPLAQPVPHEPLLTNDAGVALPAALEVREQDLRDRLIRADFNERFMGDDQPPVTHYELGEEGGGFYAEFLTPLIGSEYDREGNRRATAQKGWDYIAKSTPRGTVVGFAMDGRAVPSEWFFI
jgi:hypothetical protein